MAAHTQIRKATDDDIPALMGLLLVCFADGGFSERGLTWDRDSVRAIVGLAMSGRGVVFVAVNDAGFIEGAAILLAMPTPTNHRQFRAVETVWHADPALSDYRRARIMIGLLRVMEAWAEAAGMKLTVAALADGQRANVGDYLRRRGYRPTETIYQR